MHYWYAQLCLRHIIQKNIQPLHGVSHSVIISHTHAPLQLSIVTPYMYMYIIVNNYGHNSVIAIYCKVSWIEILVIISCTGFVPALYTPVQQFYTQLVPVIFTTIQLCTFDYV